MTVLKRRHPSLSDLQIETIILNPRVLGRDSIIEAIAGPVNARLLIDIILTVLVQRDLS